LQYVPVHITDDSRHTIDDDQAGGHHLPLLCQLNIGGNFIPTCQYLFGLTQLTALQQVDVSNNLFNYGRLPMEFDHAKHFPFIQYRLCNDHGIIVAISTKMTKAESTLREPYVRDDRRHLMTPSEQAPPRSTPIVVRPPLSREEERDQTSLTRRKSDQSLNELSVLSYGDNDLKELLYDSPETSAAVIKSMSVLRQRVSGLRQSDVTTNGYASTNTIKKRETTRQHYVRSKGDSGIQPRASRQTDIYDSIVAAIEKMRSTDNDEEKTETAEPPSVPVSRISRIPQSARTGPGQQTIFADRRRRRLFDRERRVADMDALMSIAGSSSAPS